MMIKTKNIIHKHFPKLSIFNMLIISVLPLVFFPLSADIFALPRLAYLCAILLIFSILTILRYKTITNIEIPRVGLIVSFLLVRTDS